MIPIVCISILTVLCLHFIRAVRIADEQWEWWQGCCEGTGDHALELMEENEALRQELDKWRPQRDSKGRFIKEGV